jgi:hypothetical protein
VLLVSSTGLEGIGAFHGEPDSNATPGVGPPLGGAVTVCVVVVEVEGGGETVVVVVVCVLVTDDVRTVVVVVVVVVDELVPIRSRWWRSQRLVAKALPEEFVSRFVWRDPLPLL